MRLTTASLPGTGGLLKSVPDDFVVEGLPAYPPSGDGTHTFLWIEKRALTTDEAMQRVAAALGADAREGGAAGMKDRQAVTRQWISLPNVDPDRARGLTLDGVRVLEAARHPHKLRTGHLRGNRFVVTLRGTTDGVERARAILDALAQRGLANYFGAQRFGARGDNARLGRAILDGKPGPRSRSQRRLVVSAYQSELFNRYLDRRIADDLLAIAVEGDVLKKTDTGGLFTADAAALADARARGRAARRRGPRRPRVRQGRRARRGHAPPAHRPRRRRRRARRRRAVRDRPQLRATAGRLRHRLARRGDQGHEQRSIVRRRQIGLKPLRSQHKLLPRPGGLFLACTLQKNFSPSPCSAPNGCCGCSSS